MASQSLPLPGAFAFPPQEGKEKEGESVLLSVLPLPRRSHKPPPLPQQQALPPPQQPQRPAAGGRRAPDVAAEEEGDEDEDEDKIVADVCSEEEIGEIDRRLSALQAFLKQAQQGSVLPPSPSLGAPPAPNC